MVCVRCGKDVADAHTFCGWCGQPLRAEGVQEQPDDRAGRTNSGATNAGSREGKGDGKEAVADAVPTRSQPGPKEIFGVLLIATFSLIALAVILPHNRPVALQRPTSGGDPTNSVTPTTPPRAEIPQVPRYQIPRYEPYVPPPMPRLYVPPPMRLPEIPRYTMPPMPDYSQFQRPVLQPVPMPSPTFGGRLNDYTKQVPERSEPSSFPSASAISPANPPSGLNGSVADQIDRVSRSGKYSALPPIQALCDTSSARGNATLEIKNDSEYTLTALLGGPTDRRVEVGPRRSIATDLPPGTYKVVVIAGAPDIDPAFGEYALTKGAFRVEFYIR